MNRFSKLFVLAVMLALVAVMMPTFAQEEEDMPEPGTGGAIIAPNIGSDIATLNPIITSDGSSSAVSSRIFPGFIGISTETADFAPMSQGAIVADWTISEDGLVYTFNLREDLFWSDGTQITSADVQYSYDAIVSGEVESPLAYISDDVASVVTIDEFTLEITVNSAVCSALFNIRAIPVVPSHIYSAWFPTFADMNNSRFNTTDPEATWGPWTFRNFRPGEQVTLTADTSYPDATLGAGMVIPEGWIFRTVAGQALLLEQFVAGELTTIGVPAARKADARALAAEGNGIIYEAPGNVRFVAMNTADPANPLPGLDENGDPIAQDPHPILGDVRVRQALNYAMDFASLNAAALGGEDYQLASMVRPDSWAFDPDLAVYPFDPAMADQLLTEAGWIDTDGDPNTPRVAQGALYATDGTELILRFVVNSGNTSQETMGLVLDDQWTQLGFGIDFEAIDFNVLVDEFTGQTFDLSSIFWGLGFPADPNGLRTLYDPTNDLPGAGFNASSYYNARFNEILDIANDPLQTNGCDQEARTDLYLEAYQILQEDAPWIWIGGLGMSLIQPNIGNFEVRSNLGPLGFTWNQEAWSIAIGE